MLAFESCRTGTLCLRTRRRAHAQRTCRPSVCLRQVEKAVQLLLVVANHVDLNDEDGSAASPEGEIAAAATAAAAAKLEDRRRRYRFELLRAAECEARVSFRFVVTSLLSMNTGSDWNDINPFIPDETLREILKLVPTMLLHASAIAHVNDLLMSCAKLEAQLDALRMQLDKSLTELETGAPNHKLASLVGVRTKAVTNLADQVAASLHASRHYIQQDATFDPRFLVFEFIRSLILRKGQVTIVRDFQRALEPHNLRAIKEAPETQQFYLAQQMLMGQGKTAVITPLLCLILADGRSLPIILLPEVLLSAGRGVLTATFATIINKRIYTLSCSRAAEAEPRYINLMQNALRYRMPPDALLPT
eukprot:6189299-Pleurochrysis_carterae.AAC.2